MPAPLDLLRDRLVARLIALPGVNDADFRATTNRVIETQSPGGTWPDLDYDDHSPNRWALRTHLERTHSLALRAKIDDALAFRTASLAAFVWWIEHDPINSNWWHNQIGTPRLTAEIGLLLGKDLPAALLPGISRVLDRAGDFILHTDGVTRSPVRWTGANCLWISANQVLAGALLDDASQIARALPAALSEIRIASRTEEGMQVDGSFHQHGPLLYNGGYGASFLDECLFFLAGTHGTAWEPDRAYHRLLANFLLDGTRWMLRGEDFNHGCRDREITRPRKTTAGLVPLVEFLAHTCTERRAELLDLLNSLRTKTAPGHLEGNRMFYRSDFMVQQSPEAALSVRMHSARTIRAECTNAEGLQSHHLADGLAYLTRTGAEYRDIFPVWDWQKLPGITCLQTPVRESNNTVWRRGALNTTGGVSDSRYGACMQRIYSDHLDACKSWFFGPDGMICLGAGIQSSFSGSVLTCLDQSLRQGPIDCDTSPVTLAQGRHVLAKSRWLRHGDWGFVFPQPTDLVVEVGPKTGAWSLIGAGSSESVTQDVFLAYIDHGETPANATYAYQVLPNADRSTLTGLANQPSFEIVAQTGACHAVWRPAMGLLQVAFFTPGTVSWADGWTLTVGGVCCAMLTLNSTGARHLDVADIRQAGGKMDIELGAPSGEITKRTVLFPDGDHLGSTVRVELQ